MLRSSLPEARVLPSGLNATLRTRSMWPRRGWLIWLEVGTPPLHNMIVLSSLPEARVLPSGLNATLHTVPLSAVRAWLVGAEPAISHSIILPSELPDAILLPPWSNAIAVSLLVSVRIRL